MDAELDPTEIDGFLEALQEADRIFKAMIKQQMELFKKTSTMTAQELEEEWEKEIEMFTGKDSLEKILSNKEEIIQRMEEQGIMPLPEIEKVKSDHGYYVQVMKKAYYDMNSLLSDPNMVIQAKAQFINHALSMRGGQMQVVADDLEDAKFYEDDHVLEEFRIGLLSGMAADPGRDPKMVNILFNPAKFREMVRKGMKVLEERGDI